MAKTTAYSTAREGAWTIAVGELPLATQETVGKAREKAFEHLLHGD